jgi:hypothetical protein
LSDVEGEEDRGDVDHGNIDPDLFPEGVEETVKSTPANNLPPVDNRRVGIRIDLNRMREKFLNKK